MASFTKPTPIANQNVSDETDVNNLQDACETAFTSVDTSISNLEDGTTSAGDATLLNGLIGYGDASNNMFLLGDAPAALAGSRNIGAGYHVLEDITSGNDNIGIGHTALKDVTEGNFNIALGSTIGDAITTGDDNILMGYRAGHYITTGSNNILIGKSAGDSVGGVVAGEGNVFIGRSAGQAAVVDSSYSVAIGYQAGSSSINTGELYIGNGAPGGTKANTWIYGDSSHNVTIPQDLTVVGTLNSATTASPLSGGAGTTGDIAWDANYIYVCTSTNTWKRAALTGGY